MEKLLLLASMNMTLREQFDVLEYEGLWDEAIELDMLLTKESL